MVRLSLLLLLSAAAFAQLRPANSHPTNVDFTDGAVGQIPPNWVMPPQVIDAGYRAEIHRADCGGYFASCVVFVAPPRISNVPVATLGQTFSADAYRGKAIRFSAWLRIAGAGSDGYIHIRMRVDRPNGAVDFFDSAAPEVKTAEWQRREVFGQVSSDAISISIWARYHTPGTAWVAQPEFGPTNDHRRSGQDELAVRAVILRFAALRNDHNGPAVAQLYSDQGEWQNAEGTIVVRGRPALAEIWSTVTGEVERTIQTVDFPTPDIATVHVSGLYTQMEGWHHETFVLARENGVWSIRLHQTID